jgi:hypothetical protein
VIRDDRKVKQRLSKAQGNEQNSVKDFVLPIEFGANLIGVQDKLLEKDEIFLRISEDNKSQNAKVVRAKEALVFKKHDLLASGMRTFRIIEDEERIRQLESKYL